jgi:galactokinase/mevalonate kinase-like predicted kinase
MYTQAQLSPLYIQSVSRCVEGVKVVTGNTVGYMLLLCECHVHHHLQLCLKCKHSIDFTVLKDYFKAGFTKSPYTETNIP